MGSNMDRSDHKSYGDIVPKQLDSQINPDYFLGISLSWYPVPIYIAYCFENWIEIQLNLYLPVVWKDK